MVNMKESIKTHINSLHTKQPTHMITVTLSPIEKIKNLETWNDRICNEYSHHTRLIANIIKRSAGLRNKKPSMLVTRELCDKYHNRTAAHYHGLMFLTPEQTSLFDNRIDIVKQNLCKKIKPSFPLCEIFIEPIITDNNVNSYVLKDVTNNVTALFSS